MQVFISYAREDYKIAEPLYGDLGQRDGVRPRMDRKDILAGQNWRLAIRQAIQKSSYFLARLSSNAVSKKRYVQKELRMAPDKVMFIFTHPK